MKHKKWVICPVCERKFLAEPNGTPRKHYVAPSYISLGDVQYMTNPAWMGDQRAICPGSYEKGDPI